MLGSKIFTFGPEVGLGRRRVDVRRRGVGERGRGEPAGDDREHGSRTMGEPSRAIQRHTKTPFSPSSECPVRAAGHDPGESPGIVTGNLKSANGVNWYSSIAPIAMLS